MCVRGDSLLDPGVGAAHVTLLHQILQSETTTVLRGSPGQLATVSSHAGHQQTILDTEKNISKSQPKIFHFAANISASCPALKACAFAVSFMFQFTFQKI